jgi:hypothetical protein
MTYLRWCCIDLLRPPGYPDISNNVGSVKFFLSKLLRSLRRVFGFVFVKRLHRRPRLVCNLAVGFSPTQTSLRSNFNHDYSFKLPFQGAGCPIMCTAFYFAPCPVPSCPAYEPHLTDCEYSQPLRHIQYNLIAIRRPIATLAMLLCRRIAR